MVALRVHQLVRQLGYLCAGVAGGMRRGEVRGYGLPLTIAAFSVSYTNGCLIFTHFLDTLVQTASDSYSVSQSWLISTYILIHVFINCYVTA
jgi:hypothetical protein